MPSSSLRRDGRKPGPATYLADPGLFGIGDDVAWEPPDVASREELLAAILQHRAALAVHRDNARRRRKVAALARRMGANPDTLRRKLNGERWATVLDLAGWALHATPAAVPGKEEVEAALLKVAPELPTLRQDI